MSTDDCFCDGKYPDYPRIAHSRGVKNCRYERDVVEGTTSPLDTGELRRWDGEVPARVLLCRAADELDRLRAVVSSDDLRAKIETNRTDVVTFRDATKDRIVAAHYAGQIVVFDYVLDLLAASTGDREASDGEPGK